MARAPRLRLIFVAIVCQAATALSAGASGDDAPPCSETWYQGIEEDVPTGDGQGHGPDLGSEEWKSVVEFKLGVRGEPGVPERSSEAWCRYVDEIIRSRTSGGPAPTSPSFDCGAVDDGSVEALICADPELSALDRKLADVYAAASAKATNEHPPVLAAEQRGWIKGRDECWKSDDRRACVRDAYTRRIAELQARYRLVETIGPVRFFCDGNPANEVVVTFSKTDPPTLIAERGDQVSLMFQQRSASGARYEGRNESFWEHQGEATIRWGVGAPEMRCEKTR